MASRKGKAFETHVIQDEYPYRVDLTLDDKGSPIVVARSYNAGWRLYREANQWAKPEVHEDASPDAIAFSSTLGLVIGYAVPGWEEIAIAPSKDGWQWVESRLKTKDRLRDGGHMKLRADTAGTIHALYINDSGTLDYSRISAPNGWAPELAVPMPKSREDLSGHSTLQYDILIPPNGEPQVLFRDANAEKQVPYLARLNGGAFQPLVPITDKTDPVFASGTIDGNGRAHFLLAGGEVGAPPARLLLQDCAP